MVDRLLASPRYGERWGRYWLDVARYSDDKLNSTQDEPYKNSFRYRDWVISAFNQDMPWNLFVKAQIAGDQMPDPERYRPGLGFYALSPEMQDDRVDATARGFMGLTVACAQCHNHKFDPIPQSDYYSMLGIFANTSLTEFPLAPKEEVERYKAADKKVTDKKKEISDYLTQQADGIAGILAARTADYLLASAGIISEAGLDSDTLAKWKEYLGKPEKDHPFLKPWYAAATPEAKQKAAHELEELVLSVIAERKQ